VVKGVGSQRLQDFPQPFDANIGSEFEDVLGPLGAHCTRRTIEHDLSIPQEEDLRGDRLDLGKVL
jgi:hypothetical protein